MTAAAGRSEAACRWGGAPTEALVSSLDSSQGVAELPTLLDAPGRGVGTDIEPMGTASPGQLMATVGEQPGNGVSHTLSSPLLVEMCSYGCTCGRSCSFRYSWFRLNQKF